MKESVYLYAMRATSGDVKLGVAADPGQRQQSIQTGNPFDVTVVGTSGPYSKTAACLHERKLHIDYQPFRRSGEWFDIPDAPYQGLLDRFARDWFFMTGVRCVNCGPCQTTHRDPVRGPYLPQCASCHSEVRA